MRVISGIAKGHKLVAPEGFHTRPTTDRIKETMFNVLLSHKNLNGKRFLDLFCGSGAIGIEALSRGACEAFFVDYSPSAIASLKRNLEHTKLIEKGRIHQGDVVEILKGLGKVDKGFDVIFLDPPYESGIYATVIQTILAQGLLNSGGILIAEQPSDNALIYVQGLQLLKQKDYKTTIMSFWTLED